MLHGVSAHIRKIQTEVNRSMSKTVQICNPRWHGIKGLQFQWNNETGKICNLMQHDNDTFPFVGIPPVPVPTGISDGQLKDDLQDGTYPYDVDCCDRTAPKNVLIP